MGLFLCQPQSSEIVLGFVADSSEATGLKWATPASGGMTLINTGGTTLTGASVTIGSIPGTYKNLQLVVQNFKPANDGVPLRMRFNSDSGTSYVTFESFTADNEPAGSSLIALTNDNDNSISNSLAIANIWDYTNSVTYKISSNVAVTTNQTTTANANFRFNNGVWYNTNAVTSITLFAGSGNLTSGTAFLYGVS